MYIEDKTMTNLTRTLVLTALAMALGATGAFAHEATTTTPAAQQNSSATATTQATSRNDSPVKVGDRNCIRDTGSRIITRSDKCLPVAGRSYSGKELRSTGQIDTGRALQMLDPSIRIGQ